MRTLIHLSDLHFCHIDQPVVAPLLKRVTEIAPDLIVVSGDLTQRARPDEFRAARRFLDALPSPRLVVPGNHDVPLFNLFQRFFQPLDKYRRYITDDLEPLHLDAEMAVLGINTARSLTWKAGRISEEQIERVRAKFSALDARLVKVVVTHHPFDLPEDHGKGELVGRASLAMEAFARCGADVLLSGHFHLSHAGNTAARYHIPGFAALVVQAGTATSTRSRGEDNSFNVLRLTTAEAGIEVHTWEPDAGAFRITETQTFRRTGDRWT